MKSKLLIGFLGFLSWGLIAQTNPKLTLEPYVFETRNKQQIETELGTLAVPVKHGEPEGESIQLKFVRFKSTNPNPGSPIVYLAGGPGGSGINAAKGTRFELFMAMREIADVIAFDQRGTGMSDQPIPYEAHWMYPLDEALDVEKASQSMMEFSQKAQQFWASHGVDLSMYNSNESADDLNALRKALGADKISLWSISYGSHLALATLKRHEKYLDKIILAGVEGLHQTVKLPSDVQKLLEKIDELIKADPLANTAYPDFLGDMKRLLDRVGQQPITIPIVHPITKENMKLTVGKYELQMIFSWSLRGPSTFNKLPFLVQELLNENYTVLSDWAPYTHGMGISAMGVATDVASGISKEREQRIKSEASACILADAINFPYMSQYRAWQHLDLGEEFRKPVYSDIPVLCISGTLDGRTPPGNAVEVMQTLPNSKHLIIEGAGHSDPLFLSDPGIKTTMLEFLKGNPVENQRITLPPINFFVMPKGTN